MTDLSMQIKTKFQMLLVESSATADSKLKIIFSLKQRRGKKENNNHIQEAQCEKTSQSKMEEKDPQL